jgi:uncharacterized membrane protein
MHVKKAITINRPIDDVYAFWHDFENLPRIMTHLESVRVTGPGRSRWKAQAPGRAVVEWDAVMVGQETNALIAWEAVEGSDVPNTGVVRFRPAPGDRGTEVFVELSFDVPAGKMGRTVAKLFGKDPAQQIGSDLRRFKQLLETGEFVVSDATIQSSGLAQHPAQPVEDPPRHHVAA